MYSYIGLYNFNVKRSFIDNRGGAAVCASSEPSCGSTITGIGSRASTSKEATHTQKSTKRRTTKENRGRIVATHRVCQHEYKASLKASGNWRSILGEWTPQAERKLKLGFHLCVTRMRMTNANATKNRRHRINMGGLHMSKCECELQWQNELLHVAIGPNTNGSFNLWPIILKVDVLDVLPPLVT